MSVRGITTLGFAVVAIAVTVRGWDAASIPSDKEMQAIQAAADRGSPIVDLCTAAANTWVIPNKVARVVAAGFGDTGNFATPEQVKICLDAANRTAAYNERDIAAGKLFGDEITMRRANDDFRLESAYRMYNATVRLQGGTIGAPPGAGN